ncbi:MAG: hypothetical protein IPM27_05240 [Nitrosomonadales bacterium]|nr:hypothetical protein [Nitrosomonadales bacterium]
MSEGSRRAGLLPGFVGRNGFGMHEAAGIRNHCCQVRLSGIFREIFWMATDGCHPLDYNQRVF